LPHRQPQNNLDSNTNKAVSSYRHNPKFKLYNAEVSRYATPLELNNITAIVGCTEMLGSVFVFDEKCFAPRYEEYLLKRDRRKIYNAANNTRIYRAN
jgi:hypothetical protein